MDEVVKSVNQKKNLGRASCGKNEDCRKNEDHEPHRSNLPKIYKLAVFIYLFIFSDLIPLFFLFFFNFKIFNSYMRSQT